MSVTKDEVRQKYYVVRHYVVFYAKRLWARLDARRRTQEYLRTHAVRKLQLGCWPYALDGWLNSDLHGNTGTIPLDVTKRFPLPSGSIHYVFQEHLIEHFPQSVGLAMCEESFRVLRRGGKIRISTPDLEFLCRFYDRPQTPVQKKYAKWTAATFFPDAGSTGPAFIINNFVRNWGHQFVYDFQALKLTLESAGFVNVVRMPPGESKDPHLQGLESHGKSISEEFNMLESLVVEAQKPYRRSRSSPGMKPRSRLLAKNK